MEKLRYLRAGTAVAATAKLQPGDLVVSIASGSLLHLGKVAVVDDAAPDGYAGGFLVILRVQDDNMRDVLLVNLLSQRFREFVATLKGQNISNLGRPIRSFGFHVPTDLAAFRRELRKRAAAE